MKKFLSILISAVIMMQFVIPVSAETETHIIYVSPNGSDETGDGSPDAPYLTLNQAVLASRNLTGEKRIRMHGGRYRATKTVSLNKKDNGLVIENVYGETPEITGGDYIPYSAFTKCTDESILNRIVEYTGRNTLMQVYLPDVGITEYGKISRAGFGVSTTSYAPTLTYNDRYLTLGEYPNKGYWYTKEIVKSGTNFSFTIDNPRLQKWQQAEDLWVLGFFYHDWAESISSAQVDFETGIISSYSNYKALPNRRVRFINLLEEVDAPGEYYINRETGYLYICLPEGMKEGDELRFSTFKSNFIYMSSAQNVTVQGIKFSGTGVNGISISGGSGVTINACEFTATGARAVNISSCKNAVVSNCHIHDVGGGGVYASAGNRNNLTPGGIVVENCLIERFMQFRRTYMAGVAMAGVGQRVSHCEFSDAPHEAITYSGNNHIIEYCDIYNVCNDTADCGAIYTGRDWSTQGHHIRYNYFHDMKLIGTNTGMKNHAVYLDDTHSSTSVYGNIFYKASSVALYGGGRYNTFVNNLMLECDEPFYFDNRGMWWDKSWFVEDSSDSLFKKLKAYKYNTGVWLEQYPYLANILEDEPLIPKHNTITGNVIYKTPEYNFAQEVYDYGTFRDNITIDNTKSFADYNGQNFNLLPGSEILEKIPDFKPTDFDKIGRYPYTLDNKSTAPSVTNINISGKDVLSASYEFLGYGYFEGEKTSVQWFVSDKPDGQYTKISSEKKLEVTSDFMGKYVKAEITPANNEGVFGEPVTSRPFIAGRGTNSEILKITETDGIYSFENNWTKPVTLGIFRPRYIDDEDGLKMMTDISTQFITINKTASSELKETDIAVTMDTLEPIN